MMFTQENLTNFAYFAGGIQELADFIVRLKIPRDEILQKVHLDINHDYEILGKIKFSKRFQNTGLFVVKLESQQHPGHGIYYIMAWCANDGDWQASLGTVFSYELFTGTERD